MRFLMLVSICSVLVACGDVKRPDAMACWVNAAKQEKLCFNMLTDYDKNGVRKPDAKPKRLPVANLNELNGYLVFDNVQAQTEVKRYLDESRRAYQDLKQRCGM